MKRIGLFIGVDKYTNGIQPLRCACSDAHALGLCFAKKQFDEVEYLLDDQATSSAIVGKVGKMTRRLAPGDLFVLYFAGHGREFSGTHYLVGANGYLDARIAQGRVTVSELVAASEARGVNRLFILDCCRTDLTAGRNAAYVCPGSRNLSLGKLFDEQAPKGILPPFILNSCSTGQQAYELPTEKHGVFTKALRQVLENAARPVRDFTALIDRVDAAIEKLVPPGTAQTLDQSCNPRKWGKVPLFADWETPPEPVAKPAAPAPQAAPTPAPAPAPASAPVVETPVAKPPKPAAWDVSSDAAGPEKGAAGAAADPNFCLELLKKNLFQEARRVFSDLKPEGKREVTAQATRWAKDLPEAYRLSPPAAQLYRFADHRDPEILYRMLKTVKKYSPDREYRFYLWSCRRVERRELPRFKWTRFMRMPALRAILIWILLFLCFCWEAGCTAAIWSQHKLFFSNVYSYPYYTFYWYYFNLAFVLPLSLLLVKYAAAVFWLYTRPRDRHLAEALADESAMLDWENRRDDDGEKIYTAVCDSLKKTGPHKMRLVEKIGIAVAVIDILLVMAYIPAFLCEFFRW